MMKFRLFFTILVSLITVAELHGEEDKILSNYGRDGFQIDSVTKNLIPSGEDIASLIEFLHPGGIVIGPATGGIDKLNNTRFYLYGGSHLTNQWFLNDFKIVDPYRNGSPLFMIPFQSIHHIAFKALQYSTLEGKGIHVNHKNSLYPRSTLHYRAGINIGGGYIFPDKLYDRDPLTTFPEFGDAGKKTRRIVEDLELSGQGVVRDKLYFINYARQKIQYHHPGTYYGTAHNITIMHSSTVTIDTDIFEYLIAAGTSKNDASGSKFGLSQPNTIDITAFFVHGQGTYTLVKDENHTLKMGSAFSIRPETQTRNLSENAQLIRIFEQERTNAIEPLLPTDHTSVIIQTFLKSHHIFNKHHLRFTLNYLLEHLSLSFVGANKTHIRFSEGMPIDVFLYNNFKRDTREAIHRFTLGVGYEKTYQFLLINAFAGLYDAFAALSGNNNVNQFGFTARITATLNLGKFNIYAGAMIEPIEMGTNLTRFLNTDTPSFQRFKWTDGNGNMTFEPGERGILIGQGGGPLHTKGNFAFPFSTEFYLGLKYAFNAVWSLGFNLLGKHFYNQIVAQYPAFIRNSFSFNNAIQAFDRDLALIAQEFYQLTNPDRSTFHYGTEIHLLGLSPYRQFFLRVSISAFISEGGFTFGNGALYKDMGIIDEFQADPNASSTGYFNTAADRSYMFKIAGGIFLINNLLLSGTVRFRDGEPFDMHEIKEANYGFIKTRLPDHVRFTLAVTFDIRIRYTLKLFGNDVIATLDMYNVIGSNTEIKESAFVGQKPGAPIPRLPLEAVPPRSIMLSISMIV